MDNKFSHYEYRGLKKGHGFTNIKKQNMVIASIFLTRDILDKDVKFLWFEGGSTNYVNKTLSFEIHYIQAHKWVDNIFSCPRLEEKFLLTIDEDVVALVSQPSQRYDFLLL
jgi:hypothetical protein